MIALQYNEITTKKLTQNGNKCNSCNNKIEHINQIIMQRKKRGLND